MLSLNNRSVYLYAILRINCEIGKRGPQKAIGSSSCTMTAWIATPLVRVHSQQEKVQCCINNNWREHLIQVNVTSSRPYNAQPLAEGLLALEGDWAAGSKLSDIKPSMANRHGRARAAPHWDRIRWLPCCAVPGGTISVATARREMGSTPSL